MFNKTLIGYKLTEGSTLGKEAFILGLNMYMENLVSVKLAPKDSVCKGVRVRVKKIPRCIANCSFARKFSIFFSLSFLSCL